ncbi:MAG: magnesium/cobalt transporter CorA [Candidatus Odinarchaeota archaeon]
MSVKKAHLKSIRRSHIIKRRSKKVGQPPGSLELVGRKKTESVEIRTIDYDENQITEKIAGEVEECKPFIDKPTVTWIDVVGLHDSTILKRFGDLLNLHPLVLEDILNTDQRPKVEDHGDYLFFVMKMISITEDHNLVIEQVSLILGTNYVISFQEIPGDLFEPIRERIREKRGKIRSSGADFLAYSLIDTVTDNYFLILEKIGDRIEFLEEELVTNPDTSTLQVIHHLKTNIIFLRKSVWPLREVVNRLERGESKLIKVETQKYLRDVYDHTIQVIDTVETMRDIVSSMLDIYLSSVSNKMNEVSTFLTIIATIFIPLSLLAGIYGMNFKYMPELEWEFSYPLLLLFMLGISVTLLFYFRRKSWI